jgi:endoglucanase
MRRWLFALPLVSGCLIPEPVAPRNTAGGGGNLIANATFDGGRSLPWTSSFSTPAEGKSSVVDGELCVDVKDAGPHRWDAQVRHREMTIQKGHTYAVKLKARSSRPTRIRPKVGMLGPPYAEYWVDTVELSPEPRVITGAFVMGNDDDPTAELAVHMGGDLAASGPFRICIDDVELTDPEFVRKAGPESQALRDVLVNQLGYLPHLPKIATVRSASATPLPWRLENAAGETVASGSTVPFGPDAASGDPVHVADFSSVTTPGRNYRLVVGEASSARFAIDAHLYHPLLRDALAFFYHNRSGVEIAMPWAGDPKWTRPAGHLGDKKVPCLPGSGCSYSLDVSGGWYDAGDHGKYVVNGGIAVWTLLDLYERTQRLGGKLAAFADGTLPLPERGNGIPDLLDEARFELEFLLEMQVPEGQPLAGMVHHKVHDQDWTPLGTAPHEDPQPRFLHPPSTAATLNLAAVGAQCARVFKPIAPAFAARCLTAAERAFAAAQAHPDKLASTVVKGGGPYDDNRVDDELYWAAAELWLTTGKPGYRDLVLRSPHFGEVPTLIGHGDDGQHTSMTWQSTQALGTISLAVVPSDLGAAQLASLRKKIVHAADWYVEAMHGQGYRVPFPPGQKHDYPWGSSSFVANNLIVVALAYDFTRIPRYLDAVATGIDYLLGRNPLDQSFITGYGTRPMRNPHHRFWAHQANGRFPSPPPGALSGGPNSGLEDPQVQAAGLAGCAPLKCWLDHIESYSTNEVAINWNAPLAWVAAFLDENAR